VIDPTRNEQAVLSDQTPTPIAGPSAAAAQLLQDTEVAVVQLSQGQLIWRRFRRHKLAMIGAVTLFLLTLMAIFAPLISPETYLNWNYLASNVQPRLTYPGASDWKYIMGTDSNGHSLLMWITYGARVSLAVGLISAVLTMVIAIVVGGTAGYFGGWIDAVVMRITDVFLTLPQLPLLIMLSFYLSQGSMWLIVVIFGVLSWPGAARLVRGYYLTFRQQEFTEAARAVGVSDSRIIFRHILPNAMSPVIVSTTLAVAGFIGAEAAIDFLGVGIKPPTVSWGLSLANSQNYFGEGNWWWAFFPGMFLLITTLAINFLGDGLRDALDVRSRGQ
jgi:ABC-type dipeptide/oligopeptide/nickel transport system permease subunit